jgi:hypothetical protein
MPDTTIAVDLCAGTGHMTVQLFELGLPRVVAVDKHQAVLDRIRGKVPPLYQITRDLKCVSADLDKPGSIQKVYESALLPSAGVQLVTCRQAIGYLEPSTLTYIPDRFLAPGGVFCFNTFVEPPANKLWWHRRNKGIYEGGFYLGFPRQRVYHAQFRWPRLDFTTFEWHDVAGVHRKAWERQGYEVIIEEHGRTLLVAVERPA